MIGLRGGISLALALVLCVALAIIGWGAHRGAERTIVPEITAKAASVGRSAAALVERATAAGIPVDRLVGVVPYFEGLMADNPELAHMALVSPAGVVLAQVGRGAGRDEGEKALSGAPRIHAAVIGRSGVPLADVAITIDPDVISQKVGAVLVDVAFIGIVSLLVALELVALAIGNRGVEALAAVEQRVRALAKGRLGRHEGGGETVAGALIAPIDRQMAMIAGLHAKARQEAAGRGAGATVAALDEAGARAGIGAVTMGEQSLATIVRPALFLFMMAEELTRPFLPRFVSTLLPRDGTMAPDLAVSLPIVAFMGVVALCQIPFAGLSERLGRRAGFLLGALVAALGYALSAATLDYWTFLAARAGTGVGYALVFVSAQGHVVDHARGGARATALAVFVRAIMVACLCGPPIGGVIADRLGPQAALNCSALLALVALAVAAFSLPKGTGARGTGGLSLGELKAAVAAPRLMALIAGCAFPAKFIFAALCFYLVPMALQRQGYSAAAIGRFQMIYPIAMVALVPLFAALADRLDRRPLFVTAGGLLAGAGALMVPFHPTALVIGVALLLLGMGQAMSIAPQSALVADIAAGQRGGRMAGVLGLFRLVERSGNAAGPACAGILLGAVGFSAATGLIGAMVVAGALGFALSGRGASAAPGKGHAAEDVAAEGSPL